MIEQDFQKIFSVLQMWGEPVGGKVGSEDEGEECVNGALLIFRMNKNILGLKCAHMVGFCCSYE
jgi:hypothetical protein